MPGVGTRWGFHRKDMKRSIAVKSSFEITDIKHEAHLCVILRPLLKCPDVKYDARQRIQIRLHNTGYTVNQKALVITEVFPERDFTRERTPDRQFPGRHDTINKVRAVRARQTRFFRVRISTVTPVGPTVISGLGRFSCFRIYFY